MVRSDHGVHACNICCLDTAVMLRSLLPALLCLGCPALAQAQVQAAAPSGAVAAAAEARFDVLEFEVEGNTVLAAPVVESALLPHMGPQRTLADVEAARTALEKAFQDAGWLSVLVDLPEQRVADGLVRLRVVEGRIERLRVTGARHFSQGHIRETVAAFAEGTVPDFNAAQAQLATLNRTDKRQVQPVLRPGLQPGTVEVELKVADALPMAGSVALSNHHSANTDALRLEASLRHDNLLQRGHSLALSLSTAPRATRQTRVATLGYTVPLDASSSVSLSLTHSNSSVEPLGNTVLGQGNTARLRFSQAWASAGAAHTLSLGAEYRDLQQRVRAGTQAATGAASELSTPLRYLPLQAAWDSQWWHGSGAQAAQTSLGATLTVGLRGLLRRSVPCPPDDTPQDQFACNRDGADGGFATLRLEGQHVHPMPAGLPGRLTWRTSGQIALQPLVSGEQLTIGGTASVRGYLESEASGDTGLLASLEWQGPNLARWLSAGLGLGDGLLREAHGIGFIDAGLVRVIDPLPDQTARTGLAGAGMGLRMAGAAGSSADILLAWPLRRSAQTTDGRLRVHARVALSF